jgi:hypothetical protein
MSHPGIEVLRVVHKASYRTLKEHLGFPKGKCLEICLTVSGLLSIGLEMEDMAVLISLT